MFGYHKCKCGADLRCIYCSGKGKVADNTRIGKHCCGITHYGNSCTVCGKDLLLIIGVPQESKCPHCGGTGKNSGHVCSGI